ncbi:MAG: capsular biosynthesis protein [Bacteroidales bacterium]|nr:capsular biosynthesis protein [Bacteroidales bacterium]
MFGLFKRRTSIIDSGYLEGGTDSHCHILYGVDDGVKTLEESLQILEWIEGLGQKEVWFTPHVMEDVPNTTEGLKERFEALKGVYRGGLSFHLAAEYMMDNLFEERLEARDLLLHGEDVVLVETSTWSPPIDLWGTLERMMSAGYRPLLAHPERYRYMTEADYRRLNRMGVLLQLNLPSVTGYYGLHALKNARFLLDKGWYCMSGSDCHRFKVLQAQYSNVSLDKKTLAGLRAIHIGL